MVPIGFYFLLCINDLTFPPLRHWWAKAGLVFGAAAGAEIAQGFGAPILGATFDPVDFLMFAVGTGLVCLSQRDRYFIEEEKWFALKEAQVANKALQLISAIDNIYE